ncbi:MAG: SusC/RagA family TonB-linked outer membrane protein [Mangrovibacterium sp.]
MNIFTKCRTFFPGVFLSGGRVLILLFTVILLGTGPLWAQNTTNANSKLIKVSGIVTDENGAPLPGTTVSVKGTTIGTITNEAGSYTLQVPETATLVFSFIGYNMQEIHVDKRLKIDISMEPSAVGINEVVVIGYNTINRKDLTGSIASVSAETLSKVAVTSVADALAGRMAGVQVTTSDGSPNAEISIRVRGGGSITQDNSPLYLVDGFPVDDISTIPPSDILSIDILKEASTTAIYGARGANGVVVITTKSPKAGKTTVSFNSYLQVRTLARKVDMMDPYEFVMMEYEYQRIRNNNTATIVANFGYPDDYDIYKSIKGDDWQEDILGGHPISQYYNTTIGGGSDKTKFNLSLNFNRDDGQLVGTGYQRFNANLKVNHEITKNLSLETNTTYTQIGIDGAGTEGANIVTALRYRPTAGFNDLLPVPDVDDDPEFGDDVDNTTNIFMRYPPSQEAIQNYRKRINNQFSTKGALVWRLNRNLTFRSEYGFSTGFNYDDRFYGPLSSMAKQSGMNNLPSASRGNVKMSSLRWANTLTYRKSFNRIHNVNMTLGQEISHSQVSNTFMSARYFPYDIQAEAALESFARGTAWNATSFKDSPERLSSFFARVLYDYKQRYYATFTVRADGSSKFAPGKRWGYFPAGSIAWRIDNEPFMKSVKTVSSFKLRGSYGLAGNNRIANDLWRKQYRIENSSAPGFNNADYSYYVFDAQYLYDPDLKWETTVTRNAGLDFGLFRERLTGTADIYWNTTKDLLVPSDIPSSSGFLKQLTNVGQTSNRGVEVSLNGLIIDNKKFSFSANVNLGFNRTRVDKLASGETEWKIKYGGTEWLTDYDYLLKVGESMGLIYGYVNDGFYAVDDFNYENGVYTLKEGIVNCAAINRNFRLQPGYIKFKKLSPLDETASAPWDLTDADRQVIGDTTPKLNGGFGVNATWKGFDLAAFFNFMYGFDVYNVNKMYVISTWRHSWNNLSMDSGLSKRFRYVDDVGNDLRTDPAALAEFNKNATMFTPMSVASGVPMSYIVEDGSFLRLNTLTLGYTIPSRLTKKANITSLRLYVTGYNLYTWTKYSGYDPEVNIQRGLTPGVDYNVYPRSRTFTFGVNLNF